MVQINVGPSGTPFDIHVELLCSCSPYFDLLYGNRTLEPIPSDPICFPDEDPDVFAELLAWMYHGDDSIDIPSRSDVFFLLRLWILAEKFEVFKLQNHAIELLRIEIDKRPGRVLGVNKVDYVYTHTQPQSPLRLFFVDNWVRNATQAHLLSRQEPLPYPFLKSFCSALLERRENPNTAEGEFDFAERYYVRNSRPRENHENIFSRHGDPPEPVRTATAEEASKRKIAVPSSRRHKSSPASPSPARTPVSTKKENAAKSDLASQMEDFHIV
ncbi:uncharacterized protein N7483_007403 [Penicillium malachiteum]|uniref:uncharacterized protein n=1 Tax=Penicillium malachiteum TaxID=1324776 RepID=UPI0025468A32|nr:uncharacterized protein N7483_007403 [Penicillium malachiteum]KAJ5726046.1 hypothetical protein N7483_007403 [Penicillium malachiteum]